MIRKVYESQVELKESESPGAFRATIATLNVRDRDNDVTLPGAFKKGQRVKIAQFGHNWDALPVGIGTIGANAERAWVDGQFNLNTEAGREHYETLKFVGPLGEWSYGFDIEKWSAGEHEGQPVRFLEALNVHEASPVFLGAGIGTGLDWIKQATDESAEPDDAEDEADDLKPYGIRREGDEYCVYNTETGATEKCHPTRAEALAHQRALMANVDDAGKADLSALLAKDIERFAALEPGDLDGRRALQARIAELAKAREQLQAVLKRTAECAETDPRNLFARFRLLDVHYQGVTPTGRR